jgi:SAM-dependent methyltransferase
VTEDHRRIATDFDLRSANYSQNQWHRAFANGLIAQSAIRLRDRVLDAGVGTGFAAIAAAVRVGPERRVVGVDVSSGMLQQAQLAIQRRVNPRDRSRLSGTCQATPGAGPEYPGVLTPRRWTGNRMALPTSKAATPVHRAAESAENQLHATCARVTSAGREAATSTAGGTARRLRIVRTMNAASRPTPWIIVDDTECWKCWPTK